MFLSLTRIETTPQHVVGALSIDGRATCWTIEPPWRDNMINESCIPAGLYDFRDRDRWFGWKKYGRTIEIINVPDRSDILLHPGNWARDTKGCIVPGMVVGDSRGTRAVLQSAVAFRAIMAAAGACPYGQILITELTTKNHR
jgi:hypothetical protein